MSEESVTLDSLGRLMRDMQADMRSFRSDLAGVRDQMAEFRDQMTVQTAILLRLETGQNTMAEQLRAMVRQHQRTNDRLRALEDVQR